MELLLDDRDFVAYTVEPMGGELWSACACFTDETHEYIPVANLFYGDPPLCGPDALERVREFGEFHGIPGYREALDKMMAVDALVDNNDRHLGNFGVVRNVETLRFELLAPVFDCGSSLWARPQGRPSFAPFAENTNQQIDLIGPLAWLDARALDQVPQAVTAALLEAGAAAGEVRAAADAMAWRCEMVLACKG